MELNYELHWLADATFCDVPNLARKNNPDFPFAQEPVPAGLAVSRGGDGAPWTQPTT